MLGELELEYSAVSMGNPHCVLFRPTISERETRELGPLLETDARFPNRTNVQFAEVLDRSTGSSPCSRRRSSRTTVTTRGGDQTTA